MAERDKPDTFKIAIKNGITLPLVLEQITQLRAAVDALTILVIETLAHVSDEHPKDIADRYEAKRQDFLLRRAFELEDAGQAKNDNP